MKKVQSLKRRIVAFGVLAVALVGVLLLRPSETSAVQAELPPLFPKLAEAGKTARVITLERIPLPKDPKKPEATPPAPAKKLVLTRKDDKSWVISSAFDYPARAGTVDRVLEALGGGRRQATMTTREDTFDKYADPAGWIRVTVEDGTGKTLAALGIGKHATYPEVYVKEEGDGAAKVSRAVSLARDAFSLDTEDWIEANLWPGMRNDDVSRIDVEQRRDQRTMTFEKTVTTPEAKEGEPKPASETKWMMTSPKQGEAIRMDVDDLVRAFSGMRVQDIVAGASSEESDKALGLADPELIVTAAGKKPDEAGKEAPKSILVVGTKTADGKSWNVRRKGESWVFTVSEDSLERMRKDPDSFLPKPPAPPEGEKKPDDAKKDGDKPAGDAPPGAEKPPGPPAEGSPDDKPGDK